MWRLVVCGGMHVNRDQPRLETVVNSYAGDKTPTTRVKNSMAPTWKPHPCRYHLGTYAILMTFPPANGRPWRRTRLARVRLPTPLRFLEVDKQIFRVHYQVRAAEVTMR